MASAFVAHFADLSRLLPTFITAEQGKVSLSRTWLLLPVYT